MATNGQSRSESKEEKKKRIHFFFFQASQEIEFVVALHASNPARIEALLLQISDPSNAKYSQYLSHEELIELVAPSEEALSKVHAWIENAGARVISVADTRDFVTIRAAPAAAERLLATEFHAFKHPNAKELDLLRAIEPYSVPLEVAAHVAFVSNVHSFPSQFQTPALAASRAARQKRQSNDPAIGPADLRRRYNVTGFNNIASVTQAVAEFQAQYYAPSDLQQFFSQFVPGWTKYANMVVEKGDPNVASAPGTEAELDIEYIMGVSPNVTTTFYSSATFDFWSGLTTWAALVSSQTTPPQVISVSYGDQSPASKPSTAYMQKLSSVFASLGLKGISIIFASGDSGAGCNLCVFDEPSFPATSPYVTSVGATRFIGGVLNGPEMAVNEFGSGGGLSWTFPQPSYQAAAVNEFLTTQKDNLPWWFQFNAKGRATPDVAALGIGFQVVQGSGVELVGGTSASAPTFAAIVTQLNSVRAQSGKPPLGFLNPWIYQTFAKDKTAFFDVVVGSNADSCCVMGFDAAPGYDPVTGVGTPSFRTLVKYI
jgi:tripeptidyl-peptidase-1